MQTPEFTPIRHRAAEPQNSSHGSEIKPANLAAQEKLVVAVSVGV
jgi:hypothetical protein